MLKHALVTGVSSGIGLAVARDLLADGWAVVGISRTEPNLSGPAFRWARCDVADRSGLALTIDAVCTEFPLGALIHAAGSMGEIGLVETSDPIRWADTIVQNLLGAYYTVRCALPYLREAGTARILLFSGGGAFDPFPHYSAYASAKAGVVRLAETLAAEMIETGITANCVAPGFVATGIHQTTLDAGIERAGPDQWEKLAAGQRAGDTARRLREIVACVRHLLGPETAGLTGKTISVTYDPWSGIDEEAVPALNASRGGASARLPLVGNLTMVGQGIDGALTLDRVTPFGHPPATADEGAA